MMIVRQSGMVETTGLLAFHLPLPLSKIIVSYSLIERNVGAECVEKHISRKASNLRWVILDLVIHNEFDLIMVILRRFPSMFREVCFDTARTNNSDMLSRLQSWRELDWTSCFKGASAGGHGYLMTQCLDRGVDVNCGVTSACIWRRREVVVCLGLNGASIPCGLCSKQPLAH